MSPGKRRSEGVVLKDGASGPDLLVKRATPDSGQRLKNDTPSWVFLGVDPPKSSGASPGASARGALLGKHPKCRRDMANRGLSGQTRIGMHEPEDYAHVEKKKTKEKNI